MKKSGNRAASIGAGFVLAIMAGSPAIAEDIELLVSTPNSNGANKPNILFILDSSGSMTTIEETQEPFNTAATYSGNCLSNKYYWSDSGGVPKCSSKNSKIIDKSSFVCAQGIVQMQTAGSYSDTMAQYRGTRRGDRWRRLRAGNNGMVECKADSGEHGYDDDDDKVYAQIGTNRPAFTSDSSREVVWGSSPTDKTINIYDPNYLNWYHNSPITRMSRNEIVKAVTKNVLGSINKVNVGFMRFNDSQGGPVTRAVKDLDSSRDAAIAEVDALPASGWTPLSETMYEAARYWHGLGAHYGGLYSTDPDALSSRDPMIYENPADYACAKNFNVLLTDGAPTLDVDAYNKVKYLPGYTTTMGQKYCTGGNIDGACLDDIAIYLSKHDINNDVPGDQTVKTYTIGFKVDLPLLKETAEKTGGEYYLAENVQTLTDALTDIVNNIFDREISFTAPAVSVNAFNRTQHLNDMYITVFRAATTSHWPGNVKKYTIADSVITDANGASAVNPDTGFFSAKAQSFWTPSAVIDGADVNLGGATSQLPNPADRKVFSNLNGSDLTASGNRISLGNIGGFNLGDFGLTGVTGEPTISDLIRWILGEDVNDYDDDPNTTVHRQMGDTLHSQPASVVYGGTSGQTGSMDVVVYAATNDGRLHAINAANGQELWSFIPKELLPGIVDLFENEVVNYKQYGIDGNLVPIIMDRNENGVIDTGTDFVYLVFGMRRGGNNYYALDVTNKNSPKLKWIRNFPEFGQTWSTPVPALVKTSGATSPDDVVLIMGAGYDTTHDQATHPSTPDAEGAGVFMLDIESGAQLWRAGADADADLRLASMTRSIPGSIRVIDMSGDGYADRMYAADLGGQVWRFDVHSGQSPSALVTGGVIARLGAEGTGAVGAANTRRFFEAPDIAMFTDHNLSRRFLSISIGSGYRAHPLDESAADRFYSLRDPDVFNSLTQSAYNSYPVILDSDLIDITGTFGTKLKDADRGWKFVLPPGQKILAESRTFDDAVYFVSFEPEVVSSDPCQAGLSLNRLYRVKVMNGDPIVDLELLDPNDPDEIDDERETELKQGGIAVRPMFLFPSPLDPNCIGEECAPDPVGCVGVECFDPNFPNTPVRTLWTQNGVE